MERDRKFDLGGFEKDFFCKQSVPKSVRGELCGAFFSMGKVPNVRSGGKKRRVRTFLLAYITGCRRVTYSRWPETLDILYASESTRALLIFF